jgi:hypothetical protein
VKNNVCHIESSSGEPVVIPSSSDYHASNSVRFIESDASSTGSFRQTNNKFSKLRNDSDMIKSKNTEIYNMHVDSKEPSSNGTNSEKKKVRFD